jgi:glycosyltransferase 2 family protein
VKNHLKTLLKITISTLLIGIILSTTDKQALLSHIKLLNWGYAPIIVLFIILNYVVGAFRWKKLLIYKNTHGVTVRYLTSLYFIGAFFNNFMPTSVGGDVFKVFRLAKKIGNSAHAFSATFMERFTGVIALVLISYYGLIKTLAFWVSQIPPVIAEKIWLLALFKFLLFVGFWIAAFLGFMSLRLLSNKVSLLDKIYRALISYKDSKNVLLYAFVTSFVIQFLAIFTQYFVFCADRFFQGHPF